MTPMGVRRNFLFMLGDKSLKTILGTLHSFYVWDSKASFLVVVGNLTKQKRIILENVENRISNRSIPLFHVVVAHVFLNSNKEQITEVR